MKIKTMSAALATVAFTAFAPNLLASSHSEAPGTAADPDVDQTDVWAWVQGSNLVVTMGYNGLQVPYAAPNWKKFGDDVLYELHIVRGPTSLDDALTYQFRFTTTPYPFSDPGSATPGDIPAADTPAGGNEFFAQISGGGAFNQTYSVTKIVAGSAPVVLINNAKVAPPNVGPRTNAIAYGIPQGPPPVSYESFFIDAPLAANDRTLSLGAGEGQVFAGPRDDPFYVDLGAVFDLAGLRSVIGGTPRDSVAFMNVNMIAIEIPLTVANGGTAPVAPGTAAVNDPQTVGVWASASRRKTTILRKDGTNDAHGPWRQVSRMGLPLINEAVIGLQDKDRFNRLTPATDAATFGGYFVHPVLVRDAEFADFYEVGGPLVTCLAGFGAGDIDNIKYDRFDIINVINAKDFPVANSHAITSIGDVLRVDLGRPNGAFPNGRPLNPGPGPAAIDPDVTDVLLSLLLCGDTSTVSDGVDAPGQGSGTGEGALGQNKANFPYANAPWQSFGSGVLNGFQN